MIKIKRSGMFAFMALAILVMLSIISAPTVNITYPVNGYYNANNNFMNYINWTVTETKLCYQESPNTTNQDGNDGNCGLQYTGISVQGNDANYQQGNYYYINYTKPVTANNKSLWEVLDNADVFGNVPTLANYSVENCWNSFPNTLSFRIFSSTFTSTFLLECYDNGNWDILSSQTAGASLVLLSPATVNDTSAINDGNWSTYSNYVRYNPGSNWESNNGYSNRAAIYEEAMWWNVSDSQLCLYNFNGQSNITINCTGHVNTNNLTQGNNSVSVYVKDFTNNTNGSTNYFFLDYINPQINLTTPLNNTYLNNASVNLTYVVNITQGSTSCIPGGNVTFDGTYCINTFTSDGTFNSPSSITADILIVAGGGGATVGTSANFGSGGAGGTVIFYNQTSVSGSNSIVVGQAGESGGSFQSPQICTAKGGDGGNSSFGNLAVAHGGKGVVSCSTTGGSNDNYTGGSGCYAYGGGGGAGAGANGNCADGGIGYLSDITGTPTYYAGGGGAGYSGYGGAGGGGSANGGNGTNGLGGGGGGATSASGSAIGGWGGSGVVIVRYLPSTSLKNSTVYVYQSASAMAPTSYWKFDQSSGDAIDSTGGNTLTNANGVTYVPGKLNNASYLGGTGYFINTTLNNNPTAFGYNNFTYAFWIKTTPSYVQGIVQAGPGDTTQINIYAHKLRFDQIGMPDYFVSLNSVDDGNWHRVVYTREGLGTNQLKLYIDGNLDSASTSSVSVTGSSLLEIGGYNNQYMLNGNLDDFRIYNGYAWSQSEVTSDYNNGNGEEWSPTINQLVNQTTTTFAPNTFSAIIGIPMTLLDGIYTWYADVFSSTGNFAQTPLQQFGVNTVTPSIEITYPLNGEMFNNNSKYSGSVNYTLTSSLSNCWYILNNVTIPLTCGQNITGITAQGNVTVTIYANGTNGNINSTSVNFFVDYVIPTMNLTFPINNSFVNTTNVNFSYVVNITQGATGLKNSTIYIYNVTYITTNPWCYQESANVSNQTGFDGSCGLNYIGTYELSGSWNTPLNECLDNMTDGNYSTGCVSISGDSYLFINYTKPDANIVNVVGAIWNIKLNFTNFSISLPDSCINAFPDKLSLYFDSEGGGAGFAYCWNGIDYTLLLAGFPYSYLDEESINWNVQPTLNFTLINQTTTTFAPNTFSAIIGIPITLLDGVYSWAADVFSNSGNYAFSDPIFTVDTTAPEITLLYPLGGIYNYAPNDINYTLIEANPNTCWYDLNGVNTTFSCGPNVTNFVPLQGTNHLTLYVNDSAGNTNYSATSTFFVDSLFPTISYIYYTDAGLYQDRNYIQINVTASDVTLLNLTTSLYNNAGLASFYNPIIIGSPTTYNRTFSGLGQGDYYFNSTACDLYNHCNSTNTTHIIIDTINPQISYTSNTPVDYANLSQNSIYVEVNITEINLAYLNYTLMNSTGDTINTVTTSFNYNNFTSLVQGSYSYYVTVVDLSGNMNQTDIRHILLDYTAPNISVILGPVGGLNGSLGNNGYLSNGSIWGSGNFNISGNYFIANTFNNSLTTETISLPANSIVYRYLDLPVNQLTSAYMTLTGPGPTNLCYQVFYNDTHCGNSVGQEFNNYTKQVQTNYSKPSSAYNNSIWNVTSYGTNLVFQPVHTQNLFVLPFNCWNSSVGKVVLNIYNSCNGTRKNLIYQCYNGTRFITLGGNSNPTCDPFLSAVTSSYTQQMIWNLSSNNQINNLGIYVNNSQVLFYPGNSSNIVTNNFANSITNYLSVCPVNGTGWCSVPIGFNSSVGTSLTYSNLLFSDSQFFTINASDNQGLANSTLYFYQLNDTYIIHFGGNYSGYCYQQSANVPNQTGMDGSCELSYNGTYTNNAVQGAWSNIGNAYDGNWNTYTDTILNLANLPAGFFLYSNYTIPQNAVVGSVYRFAYGGASPIYLNKTIPSICFNNGKVSIQYQIIWDGFSVFSSDVACYDGSGYYQDLGSITSPSTEYFNDGAMIWNISSYNKTINDYVLANNQTQTFVPGTLGAIVQFPLTLLDGVYSFFFNVYDWAGNSFVTGNNTITIDSEQPTVTITYPTNGVVKIPYATTPNINITLNWTVSMFNLDHLASCWYSVNNGANISVPCFQNTTIVPVVLSNTPYIFTVYAESAAGLIGSSFVNSTFGYYFLDNQNRTYNNFTWETQTQSYIINVSYDPAYNVTGTFVYDGVYYPTVTSTSGSYAVSNATIDVPAIPGVPLGNVTSKNFYWILNITDMNTSTVISSSATTTSNQTIGRILFDSCDNVFNQLKAINQTAVNTTSANLSVYLNVLFKDELALTPINQSLLMTTNYYLGQGTTSELLTYNNVTPQLNFPFCFSLPQYNLNLNITHYQYQNPLNVPIYPARDVYTGFTPLTNSSTTNVLLYNILQNQGQSTSFYMTDLNNIPLANVDIVMQTIVNGNPFNLEESTDSAGVGTFWVNPNAYYTVTMTRTGCLDKVLSIRPTQASYGFQMNCNGNQNVTTAQNQSFPYTAPISYIYDGVTFTKSPRTGQINPGTYTFEYQVNSNVHPMTRILMILYTSNSTYSSILRYVEQNISQSTNATICNVNSCYINTVLNMNFNTTSRVYGAYYADFGQGYLLLESDGQWYTINSNFTSLTLRSAITDLSGIFVTNNFDPNSIIGQDYMRAEFSRMIWIFLIMAILFAFFNKYSGYDSANPGAFLLIMTVIVFLGSAAGGLTGNGFFYISNMVPEVTLVGHQAIATPGAAMAHFINNYLIAIYMMIFVAGYWLSVSRRQT